MDTDEMSISLFLIFDSCVNSNRRINTAIYAVAGTRATGY